MTMMFSKGLPYEIFWKQILNEMRENGQLYQIQKKWKITKPDCTPLHGKGSPLGKKFELMDHSLVMVVFLEFSYNSFKFP